MTELTSIKLEGVPESAYAVGQTDLDGMMVVRADDEHVYLERAPWAGEEKGH